jgi:hypothetical protein
MWLPLKNIASLLRRRPVVVTLQMDDERVTIQRSDREEPLSFCWRDVEEIRTFKLDLLTTDDVRLAFRVSDGWYELSEEHTGFMELSEAMRAKFPSIPEDWYQEVMQPAFATNQRTLWKRG